MGPIKPLLTENTQLPTKKAKSSESVEKLEGFSSSAEDTEAGNVFFSLSTDISGDETQSEQDEADTTSYGQTSKRKSKAQKTADFATSMSKILNSHIKSSDRADPVLIRARNNNALRQEEILEYKAKKLLLAEKRKAQEKGHVRDVLRSGEDPEVVQQILETEEKLQKTAQQGVIKLLDAIRESQINSEVAMRQVKEKGVIGIDQRQEQVAQLSKASFLDLIKKGNT